VAEGTIHGYTTARTGTAARLEWPVKEPSKPITPAGLVVCGLIAAGLLTAGVMLLADASNAADEFARNSTEGTGRTFVALGLLFLVAAIVGARKIPARTAVHRAWITAKSRYWDSGYYCSTHDRVIRLGVGSAQVGDVAEIHRLFS